jgi:hypothetical protein
MDPPRCFCRKMKCPRDGEQQGGLPACQLPCQHPSCCAVDAALSSPTAGLATSSCSLLLMFI